MACAGCREVIDVPIRRLSLPDEAVADIAPRCPACGAGEESLALWRSDDPCPRCAESLSLAADLRPEWWD